MTSDDVLIELRILVPEACCATEKNRKQLRARKQGTGRLALRRLGVRRPNVAVIIVFIMTVSPLGGGRCERRPSTSAARSTGRRRRLRLLREPYDEVMNAPAPNSGANRRPNRRGVSSRKHVLDTALRVLAANGPDGVSATVVAKEANVTWGTLQYQFGDADGLWAAAIAHVLDTAGPQIWARPSAGSVEQRVTEVVDLLWNALDSPYNAAVTNLRVALAKDRAELERNYPRTAQALDALEDNLAAQFREFFDGILVDPRRARQVSALLPSALRGLHLERAYGSHVDVDDALTGLREAVVVYLNPIGPPGGGRPGAGATRRTRRRAPKP